jgi:hypothetical protein
MVDCSVRMSFGVFCHRSILADGGIYVSIFASWPYIHSSICFDKDAFDINIYINI